MRKRTFEATDGGGANRNNFDVLALVEQVRDAVVHVCGVHYPAEKYRIAATVQDDSRELVLAVYATNYTRMITAQGFAPIHDIFARHKLADHTATCCYVMWDLHMTEQKRGGVAVEMRLPLSQVCDSLDWLDTHRERRLARSDDAIDTLNCIRVACGYDRVDDEDG